MTFVKFQLEYFCIQAELHATLDHCGMLKAIIMHSGLFHYWAAEFQNLLRGPHFNIIKWAKYMGYRIK